MNSNIATARAFLSAGNLKLALEQAHLALKRDPRASAALDVYCDILLKLERFDDAEKVAIDWIATHPQQVTPYFIMLNIYADRKDKKMAQALVEHFRVASIAPQDFEVFEATFIARFGDKASGYTKLADYFAKAGDKAGEFRLKSYVAIANSNISEAIIESEFARGSGDNSAQTASRLSMLSFRVFRFRKCREYAELALKADPTCAIPQELLILSRLVYFPPFLVAHMGLAFITWMSRKKSPILQFAIAISLMFCVVPIAFLASKMITVIPSLIGIPPIVSYGLFFSFAFYAPYIGMIAKYRNQTLRREVKLKDY
jgi:tetratricopeptide (TPR) repeat protein